MSVNSNESTSININPLVLHRFDPSYLNQLFIAVEEKAITGLSYPLQANPDLECPHFAVHHFASLFRAELTKDEGLELIEHLPECLACSAIYHEVYKLWEHSKQVTRVEELNYLRNSFGGISTIKSEIRRKFIKRCVRRLEKKLKQDLIVPLQQQVQELQAQVQQLLVERQEVSSNAK